MTTDISNRRRITVGVLRGGPSHEYDVSLQSGAHVLKNLPQNYRAHDIFISRDGDWHFEGVTKKPEKILKQVDLVFNALHGKYGEDGKIQNFLEQHSIPFTGSKTLPSALGMNKNLSRKIFTKHGIKMPVHVILYPEDHTRSAVIELFRTFPQPSIIKPVSGGSSLATTIARDFASFQKGIEEAFRHAGAAIIEEYISGIEATCGVLEKSDKSGVYALFPVEIATPLSKGYYDYDLKQGNSDVEICPSTFSADIKRELQEIAILMHTALGLKHYSRSDFIVHPKRGIYALETNSLPALGENSPYTKSLYAAGITFPEFLDHLVTLSLN